MENGELPDWLNPPVFWVLVGTNDLSDDCNPDSVLMGILRDVLELRLRRPNATIVVNSILPRADDKGNWESFAFHRTITYINERLACIVQAMDNMDYFDATNLFLDNQGRVDKNLLGDFLHPSAEGTKIWGSAILERIKELNE